MKLTSRRTIILHQHKTCLRIDDNVPIDDTHNSILKRRYPLEDLRRRQCGVPRVIGTFNGIVLLAYLGTLILYNPFTGAFKKLPEAPVNHVYYPGYDYGYGFGYGAPPIDLKIVRFGQLSAICNVYSFQNSSWSTSRYNTNSLPFEHDVGTLLNGLLYWITFCMGELTVLNLKDMELSMIHLPFERGFGTPILGTIDGCLCLLNDINDTRFDVWVMKKHDVENLWSIKYSFNLPLEGTLNTCYYSLCILDSGRILLVNASRQLVIYDMSNGSYFNFLLSGYYSCHQIHGLEYMKSLFSPSYMCPSLELKYNNSIRKRKT